MKYKTLYLEHEFVTNNISLRLLGKFTIEVNSNVEQHFSYFIYTLVSG